MNTVTPPSILIVDDQELMFRILQATLKTIGARMLFAKTGAEALQHLIEKDPPNAIILDYMLPDQNGIDTLRAIRNLPAGRLIPVLMLTARDQSLIREAAEGLNVKAFMTKPFSPNLLLQTIKEMLREQYEVDI